ncbi:hypothetical protein KSS87_004270 [Heliosperma pusillum]|nr:hypothetical protein KSS87_004270 [Heliosperma pusillum]
MSGSTLSNPDDPSSPFIILNVHSVTKFDGSNYRQWRTQLESLFDGYGLLSFLDGTPPPPKTVASATTQEDPNPAFKTWYRQDKLLFSVVASTVTSAVSPLLNRVSTTNEAWDILASTYARPSRGHIKQLRHKLKHITKGTTSISAYMTRIKTIVDDLALLGTVIPAEDVTDQVLDGLDSTYQPVIDAINARDDPIAFPERGPPPRGPFQNRDEPVKVQKKEDDGDNWEMP